MCACACEYNLLRSSILVDGSGLQKCICEELLRGGVLIEAIGILVQGVIRIRCDWPLCRRWCSLCVRVCELYLGIICECIGWIVLLGISWCVCESQ